MPSGVFGGFMKRLACPRPPLVVGLVIGAIFERYLYISTSLYGIGWLWHASFTIGVFGMSIPMSVVLIVLILVAGALYRPLSEIMRSIIAELRPVGSRPFRFSASAPFTVAIFLFIGAAILRSTNWPAVAKPVPLTACGMALTAAALNLVNELFGKEQTIRGNVDGGVAAVGHGPISDKDYGMSGATIRRQATIYFFWLASLMALMAAVRFFPAFCIFIFASYHLCF